MKYVALIEWFADLHQENPVFVRTATGLIVSTLGIFVYVQIKKRWTQKPKEHPVNTVILHQIGRGPYAPSMTPFAVKLETFLRMAKIPYQNVQNSKRSSKGKFPWIEYNGQNIADSTFCIDFLNNKLGIDLNTWLSSEQKAEALAFQRLVEDDLYWTLAFYRWIWEVDLNFLLLAFHFPWASIFLRYIIMPAIRKQAWNQGMARHSPEEVEQIAYKDLKAIADFIGTKQFLMGDQPCEVDCAVFGQLSQLHWHSPNKLGKLFHEKFPTLVQYCERMKLTFWSDWDECITHGNTREATNSGRAQDELKWHPVLMPEMPGGVCVDTQ